MKLSLTEPSFIPARPGVCSGSQNWECRFKADCPGICVCPSPVTETKTGIQCGSVVGFTLVTGISLILVVLTIYLMQAGALLVTIPDSEPQNLG